jgi:hypothetical protein
MVLSFQCDANYTYNQRQCQIVNEYASAIIYCYRLTVLTELELLSKQLPQWKTPSRSLGLQAE